MRPNARNRATAPRFNLNSPPVPASFAVEQPTQQELQLRETIASVRGVRVIESAWPAQPTRQAYIPSMPGRGNHNVRSGGSRYPTGNANSRTSSFPGDDGPSNHPGSFPKQTKKIPVAADATSRGREMRTVPLLFSLPTESERLATREAQSQAKAAMRNAEREERRNRNLVRSGYVVGGDSNITGKPPRRVESANSGGTPGHRGESSRSSLSPFPLPPLPPPSPQRPSSSPPSPSPASFLQAPNMPALMANDWRNWPEITVKVGPDLPLKYTTWDMYHLFTDYGDVESVELFENSRGTRNGYGKVRFSRVSKPFWNQLSIPYLWDNTEYQLKTNLETPRRTFKIPSPVNKNKLYPEKFTFKPEKMDFGFMVQQDSMVAMYTTNDTDEITFEVNLFRKYVDVTFNIYLAKEEIPTDLISSSIMDEQAEKSESESGQGGRRENYRFRIPFARLGQILEQGPIISEKNRVFIISLPSPPLFWRKLHNVATSHDHTANFWTTWDMWFRQTGIAFDPLRRSKLPISLRQALPTIDTGRWTTYRFKFALESHQVDPFKEMISAFGDFNVSTKIYNELRVACDQPEPIWDTINVGKTSLFTNSFSDLSEAMTPLLLFPTRYQLEVCISQNFLNEYNLTPEFINRLTQLPPTQAVSFLEYVAEKKTRIYNPMEVFNLISVTEGTAALKKKKALPDYCQLVRKATITPSTVYYTTPTVEITNRVMRHYSEHSDRFLRVQFMDENEGRINSTDKKTMHEVFSRIMTAMENGIVIGDRHFEFLAFGNSQVREHGAYFFASADHISAADIRAWMGDFRDIRVVAKHAARLGQCFSTTRAIHSVRVDVREIGDIKYSDNEYCFSDGVGKISDFLSRMIATELKLPKDQPPPSCIQFRLGGCKGVLAVWPEAKQREVFIRPSQRKFQATHNVLEVIRTSKPAGAALNRQLIIVLSSLGTPDNVFVLKLTEMLSNFQDAMHDSAAALSLLCKTIDENQFTLALASMVRDKFMDHREPFIMSLLGLWRAWSIKYLKEKARITIDKGAFVLGIVDETGILKGYYEEESSDADKNGKGEKIPSIPEIFLQISDPDNPGKFRVIEGLCIIARNPSLHPGDIRTVHAVNVPELGHLHNVVVFPNKGDRDLASMLSGGDLDGDDYIVIWDPELTFGVTNHKPMDYSPLEPRTLNRDVTVKDITKFFVNYMRNDKLGTIANAHLAWADFLEDGVKSDQCFQLAALHSDAVDYVKTGEPAEMPRNLRPRKYPHFMGKEPEKSRQSNKILGRLYDMVVKIDFIPSYELQFDDRVLSAYLLSEDLLAAARAVKAEYDAALHRIMAQHDIRTEFEVYSTFVIHHSTAAKDYKFHEEIANIRDSLTDFFRKMVIDRIGCRDEKKLGPFVAAMYTITKQELDAALESRGDRKAKGKEPVKGKNSKPTPGDVEEMPLISFPWLFPEILGRLANREYPFTNLENTLDGSLKQYEYEHVTLPDTKRGAAHGTGVNSNFSRFKSEIYNFKQNSYTAADDLAGLEIEPAGKHLEDGGEAYTSFDYKQGQQNPDCRAIGNHITKKENYNLQNSNSEASGSRNTPVDYEGGLSFCEQLFREIGPETDIFQETDEDE